MCVSSGILHVGMCQQVFMLAMRSSQDLDPFCASNSYYRGSALAYLAVMLAAAVQAYRLGCKAKSRRVLLQHAQVALGSAAQASLLLLSNGIRRSPAVLVLLSCLPVLVSPGMWCP